MVPVRRKTMDQIDLSIGDPNDPPPACLVERAQQALLESDASHYPLPHSGHIQTKEAACHYYEQKHGIKVSTDQVCITPGALPSLTYALRAVNCKRTVCGVFTPFFPAFVPAISAAGFQLHQITLPALPLSDTILKALFAPIAGGVFLLNNPNNPTGRVFTEAELRSLDRITRAYNIRVLSDAVYIDIYEGPKAPTSYLQIAPDALEVVSLSKTFRLPGYRVGAVVGDRKWVDGVVQSAVVQNGIPAVFQKVAQLAWMALPEVDAFKYEIAVRRAHLVARLRDNGFEIDTTVCNRAGIFVWGQIPSRWETASQFVDYASKRGVRLSCGDVFGRSGERHIRWALNADVVRLDQALAQLELVHLHHV